MVSDNCFYWTEQIMEHESDSNTNSNWHARYSHQTISTGTGGLANKRTSGDLPKYSIFVIGENTRKSLGDFRRFAVAHTSVDNHGLTLV